MTKHLLILTVLAAVAGPAAASESITVSLAGKTPEEIHTELVRSANIVCARAYDGPLTYYLRRSCVTDTLSDAEAALSKVIARAKVETLASAR